MMKNRLYSAVRRVACLACCALLLLVGSQVEASFEQAVKDLGSSDAVKCGNALLELRGAASAAIPILPAIIERLGDTRELTMHTTTIGINTSGSGMTMGFSSVRGLAMQTLRALGDFTLEPILTALGSHPSPEVRAGAALALSEWGTPNLIPSLTAAFDSGDERIRAAVVTSLAGFQDDSITGICRRALSDPSALVREAVAKTALARKDRSLLPDLVSRYVAETHDQVLSTLAHTLGRLKDPLAEKALAARLPNETTVRDAAEALGMIPAGPDAGPVSHALRAAWEQARQPQVAKACLEALEFRHGKDAVVAWLTGAQTVIPIGVRQETYLFLAGAGHAQARDFLLRQSSSSDADTRDAARKAIEKAGARVFGSSGKAAAQVDAGLSLSGFDSPYPEARRSLALALAQQPGRINDPQIVSSLCQRLAQEPDAKTAEALKRMLEKRAEPTSLLEPLLPLAASASTRNRPLIVALLGTTRDSRAVPVLMEARKANDKFTVEQATYALAKMPIDSSQQQDLIKDAGSADLQARRSATSVLQKSPTGAIGADSLPVLISQLQQERDESVCRNLRNTIMKSGNPEVAVPLLEQAFAAALPMARRYIAGAAGGLKHPWAVRFLGPGLSDPELAVAVQCAESLGEIKDPSGIDWLIGALDSGKPKLIDKATWALRVITKQDLGKQSAAWRSWRAGN